MELLDREWRMYGMVPYNISPIQQGIQFGHAVVDYGRTVKGLGLIEDVYNKWADEDKTFIILNGGTTNTNLDKLGTLNTYLNTLNDTGHLVQSFHEPDLGDQLTAIVFLVSEMVWDKEKYPDLDWQQIYLPKTKIFTNMFSEQEYNKWVESIGGVKNAFLREFLNGFSLA